MHTPTATAPILLTGTEILERSLAQAIELGAPADTITRLMRELDASVRREALSQPHASGNAQTASNATNAHHE